ncbi:MAG: nitrogenase component 1 [Oscillospiraceae bacterium]
MNTNFPKPVPIGEVAQVYRTGKPHPLDQKYNLRYVGGGGGEGGGSPVSTPLVVPGSAVLFMAPLACGRHNSMGALAMGRKDRIWYMRLEERDIVSGLNARRAKEALLEMARTCEPRPQAIFLCVTCVDMLLASDYRRVAAEVEAETGIRIGRALMCPLLNESKTPDPTRTWNFITELLRTDKNAPREKTVNLIGNYQAPGEESELHELLGKAGIRRINHYTNCPDMEAFDRMGQASYSLAYNYGGILACQTLEKRYHIPYANVATSFDPDVIHQNYRNISRMMGVEIDDSAWYRKTRERIAEVVAKCGGRTVAVGESLDDDPFRAAGELCRLGFNVKTMFTRFVRPEFRESVEWLQANHPEVTVYFSAHPGMYYYPPQPDHYDLAFGLTERYTKGDSSIQTVAGAERQPDYRSILDFLERVEKSLRNECDPEPSLADMLFGPGGQQKILGYSSKNRKRWGPYVTAALRGKEGQ